MLFLLTIFAGGLAAVVVLKEAAAQMPFDPATESWRLALRVAADALERGEPFDAALLAHHDRLPAAYRRRLRRGCARLLAEDGSPGAAPGDLVAWLAAHRLVPRRQVRVLAAARDCGRGALIACCRRLAGRTRVVPQLVSVLALWLPAVVLVAIALFLLLDLHIAGRFVLMLGEIDVPPPAVLLVLWAMAQSELAQYAALALAVLLALLSPGLLHAWRVAPPGLVRRERGRLLLAGLERGADETALAGALAHTWRRPPAALARAGAAGDLAGLAKVCGWRAATPAALVAALARDEQRRRRRALVLGPLLCWLLVLALATPVLLFAVAVFGSLVRICEALMQGT